MKKLLLAVLLLSPSLARAQEERETLRYTPPSQTFTCDLPSDKWHAFEEEEGAGFAAHVLGPDNPTGTYRSGIDIRFVEKGQIGWMPVKKYIDEARRGDGDTGRQATLVRPYRISGYLARVFEVVERRNLPGDQLPSLDEELHHYYAVIPMGESYYTVKLSTTRDVYFDYRQLFVKFLHSFKPLGYASAK